MNGNIFDIDGKAVTVTAEHPPKICTGLILAGHDPDIKHEQQSRIYSSDGKSPTLMANSGGGGYDKMPKVAVDKIFYRKLTVKECERCQTMDDGYTEGVSNSQRYKMIGNGWTIEAIVHIFQHLKVK